MPNISSNTNSARRSSLLLVIAAAIAVGCGQGPQDPGTGTAPVADPGAAPAAPADPGAAPVADPGATPVAAPAVVAAPSLRFTCTTTSRTSTKLQAAGTLTGTESSGIEVTILATGGVLVSNPTPVVDPGFEGGIWETTYGLTPWSLGSGAQAGYHLMLPATASATFRAYLVATYTSGARVMQGMACTAESATGPAAPVPGRQGVATRSLACATLAAPAGEGVAVTGALDALGRPRDVRIFRAGGQEVARLVYPVYDPTFDGGFWETQSGLFAWPISSLGAERYVLLVPGRTQPATFDAAVIVDYGAAGRVQLSLSCTAQ
jgi:hypothetical protein